MRYGLILVGACAVLLGGGWWYLSQPNKQATEVVRETETATQEQTERVDVNENQGAVIGEENLVTFQCDGGKSITAVFERDIVGLTLSDGRQLVLRQAPSAIGMRYLSNDTTIEFRGKGSEGSLIEGGSTTYANCKASL